MSEENENSTSQTTINGNDDLYEHVAPHTKLFRLEISSNSTIERNIFRVVRKHFFEQKSILWKPIQVELIVNSVLTEDFFGLFSIENERKEKQCSTFLFSDKKTF